MTTALPRVHKVAPNSQHKVRHVRCVVAACGRPSAALDDARRRSAGAPKAVEVAVVRELARGVHHGGVAGTEEDVTPRSTLPTAGSSEATLAKSRQLVPERLGRSVDDLQPTAEALRTVQHVHLAVVPGGEETQHLLGVPRPVAAQFQLPGPQGVQVAVACGAEHVGVHGPRGVAVDGHVLQMLQLRPLAEAVVAQVRVHRRVLGTRGQGVELAAILQDAPPLRRGGGR